MNEIFFIKYPINRDNINVGVAKTNMVGVAREVS